MRIQPQQNNINFKSIPIHNVNIKDNKNQLVKAVFSELIPDSTEDCDAVFKICNNWKSDTEFLHKIFAQNFLKKEDSGYNFFALELPKKEPLDKKIVGLASTVIDDKNFELSLIFTNPNLTADNVNRNLKNIGEVLMGSLFNIAKQENSKKFVLSSISDNFYHKIFQNAKISPTTKSFKGFDNFLSSNFSIKKKDFSKFIDYCQNKFNIDFS